MQKNRPSSRTHSNFGLRDTQHSHGQLRRGGFAGGIHTTMTLYTVADVQAAEFTLEPLTCIFCGSQEVTYLQYIGDGQCATCGCQRLRRNVPKQAIWKCRV